MAGADQRGGTAERAHSLSLRKLTKRYGAQTAIEDVTIGGWDVPNGSVVVVAQAIAHRDPRWWSEPDRFDPRRFAPEVKRPKFAYFPFGGGTRVCIGESFAWMEGVLLLATLAQRWRMELISRDVQPKASITLRPKGGIRMTLSPNRTSAL